MFNPNVWVKNIVSNCAAQSTLTLLGRVLIAYLFIIAGWNKIGGYAGTAAFMESKGLPGDLLMLVILLELGGGLAILVGFQTRIVALIIAIFNVLTGFMFHGSAGDETNFMKNIGLAGGYLYLVCFGAGCISLDYLLERKTQ